MTAAGDINLSLETVKGSLGKFVQAVLGFVGTIVFARALGPTSFGGFYFLLTLVLVVDRPIRGVDQAIKKRYSEADPRKSDLVGFLLLSLAAFSLVVGVVAFAFGDILVARTNVHRAPLVFVLLVFSIGLFTTFQSLLAAEGWPAKGVWNDTLRSVFTLVLQLAFVLGGFGAAGMGYGLAAATLLSVPPILYYVRVRPSLPSRETAASVWQFAKYSVPGSYIGIAYNKLDHLLLGVLVSTAAVGQYEVAWKLTVPGTFVATALSNALMPKLSNLHSRDIDISDHVTNALAFNSILSIPIFFGVLALSEDLVVTIYGGGYAQAATMLTGLAFFQVVRTQADVLRDVLLGIERLDIGLPIQAGALLVNVVLGVALLTEYGPIGVVAATIISEILIYVAVLVAMKRVLPGLSPFGRPLLAQVISGAAMFVVVEFAARFVRIQSWVDLLLLVGLGVVVYGVVLLAISPGVRTTVQSVLTDVIGE